MRENGLQRPYNAMQIGTWILLPALILQFLFFVSPILPLGASVPCTVLFFVFGYVSAYFAYLTCKTDPIDDLLKRHLRRQERARNKGATAGEEEEESPPDNEDGSGETKFCWVCQTSVHDHSMHCKFCDKCVSNFDHHCLWLNTCVGTANYQYFFNTVIATFMFVLVHLGCLAGVVVPYFLQRTRDPPSGGTYRRMEGWFGAGASEAVAGVNLFFLAVGLVSISLLGQLTLFHLGLRREGITTYAYIVRDNAQKREKSREATEVRSRRVMALRKARDGGDSREVFLLRMGGWWGCAPCDPVRRKMREEEARESAKGAGNAPEADRADEEDGDGSESSSPSPVPDDVENGFNAEGAPSVP